MPPPARSLRAPLHGNVSTITLAACRSASQWGPSTAIERRQRPLLPSASLAPALHLSTAARLPRAAPLSTSARKSLTTLQEPATPPNPLPELALFTSYPPLHSTEPATTPNSDHKPPDERKVKLGKTLRILQTHLPTLLQSPLPHQILSPQITLHLFPSTHPHLPTVSGRVAYMAALWSSPIAWNRVPLVGNVRLEILSERMVTHHGASSRGRGACGEQLVVRWRTAGKGGGWLGGLLTGLGGKGGGGAAAAAAGEGKAPVGMAQAVGEKGKEFTGLFIFDFDEEGRILSHTIEHVQEGGQWEKGVGAKVVGLTDWLLGGIKGGDAPCPAFARARWRKGGS